MAISRVKNWIAGDILTAADLNAEFNNIINNAVSLISPLTASLNVNNQQLTNLKLETQSATQSASVAGRIYWQTSEGTIHIDTGSLIARTPAITKLEQGDLVIANAPTVSGATTYTHLRIGSAYGMMGVNAAGTQPRYRDLIAGSGVGITFADANLTFTAAGAISAGGVLTGSAAGAYTTTVAQASWADVDATNLKASVTVPVGAKFLFVWAWYHLQTATITDGLAHVRLLSAGTAQNAALLNNSTTNFTGEYNLFQVVASPTSGSQTISLQFSSDGATTFTLSNPTREGPTVNTIGIVPRIVYAVTT